MEFQQEPNKLRLIGKIIEAPEDVQKGSYHTIEVKPGKMLSIEKDEWKKEHLEMLEKAKAKIEFLKDPNEIENLFTRFNKGDALATYGFDQVKTAASIGAVKIVFIPEEKVRTKKFEELIEEISSKKGEIRIVSKKFSIGEKFIKMYEIAAILRFPIE